MPHFTDRPTIAATVAAVPRVILAWLHAAGIPLAELASIIGVSYAALRDTLARPGDITTVDLILIATALERRAGDILLEAERLAGGAALTVTALPIGTRVRDRETGEVGAVTEHVVMMRPDGLVDSVEYSGDELAELEVVSAADCVGGAA